jgi:prepilin-type N-terminal cleavage/methylation domain-containing protein
MMHLFRHSGGDLGRNPLSHSNKSAGFTLIEVLIAAVILFSALAITAELYSASSLSSQKASSKAHFYQINPMAITAIKTEIRQLSENRKLTELSSALAISGIHYQWQAQRIAFEPRAPDFDDFSPPKPQFGLFEVVVIAQNIKTEKVDEFQFKVATW